MNLADYAFLMVEDIQNKKYSFSFALNKKISSLNLTSSEENLIKNVIKYYILHYYSMRYEVDDFVLNWNKFDIDYLLVLLSFTKCKDKLNLDDVLKMALEAVNEQKVNRSFDELKNIIENNFNNHFDPKLKFVDDPIKEISYLYSYPEWVVRMMNKHFGKNIALKSIVSSRKMTPLNVAINLMKISEEEILKDGSFKKSSLASTSYEYVSLNPLSENNLFKDKKVFISDEEEQIIADNAKPQNGDEILLVGENKEHLAILLDSRINDLGRVYYYPDTYVSYFNNKKLVEAFGLKSLFNLVPGGINLLCTHFKDGQCDKVIVFPPNSEIGLVRKKPEILLTLDQNNLDNLISNQYLYLVECSKIVKEGGLLIYGVQTLSLKESSGIINEFIKNNEQFELINEKFDFPFTNETTGMYYAILKRKSSLEVNHD